MAEYAYSERGGGSRDSLPVKRNGLDVGSVENFEDGNYDLLAKSPDVEASVIAADVHAGPPHYVRHKTSWLRVRWREQEDAQVIAFNVPPDARDTTEYSHFAVRVGQFANPPEADLFGNPVNDDQVLLVCLKSPGKAPCWWTGWWDPIPPVDPQPDGVAHSAMSTISMDLPAFEGVDRSNVEAVVFVFPSNTKGTLMLDSLEWHR